MKPWVPFSPGCFTGLFLQVADGNRPLPWNWFQLRDTLPVPVLSCCLGRVTHSKYNQILIVGIGAPHALL